MSFRILYAGSNRPGAKLQLFRFLDAIKEYNFTIKLAGFRNMKMNLDWTLDALDDIMYPDLVSTDNDVFTIYFQQIKQYAPDLIISDLEYYTSYAGQLLNIKTWQISPLLFYFGSEYKERLEHNTHRNYEILLDKLLENALLKNVIVNSDRLFVYSCIGDLDNAPKLIDKYDWIRPYHYVGKQSEPCKHNIVIATHKINQKIEALLKESDTVIFSDPKVPNTKNIYYTDEYACNLKNACYCINSGLTDLIADAIYNGKCPTIVPDLFDIECAMNATTFENYGLINTAYDGKISDNVKEINMTYKENIKFLHEEIIDLIYNG